MTRRGLHRLSVQAYPLWSMNPLAARGRNTVPKAKFWCPETQLTRTINRQGTPLPISAPPTATASAQRLPNQHPKSR
jgi:hypothetical protein